MYMQLIKNAIMEGQCDSVLQLGRGSKFEVESKQNKTNIEKLTLKAKKYKR